MCICQKWPVHGVLKLRGLALLPQMWAWNKVALMRKVLAEMPPERAPWILYMQPDTIIDDIAFTFPFEMYQGKDWVSVGTSESVLQGWASGAC